MHNKIIFGTSCLGNLYRVVPMEIKIEIAAKWFEAYQRPTIDSAGKYGAGLSLECIGKALKTLGRKPNEISISVKLGWRRKKLVTPEPTFEPGAWAGLEWDAEQDISHDGILRCYEEALTLLGGYPIDYVSVHDPDEYIHSGDVANRTHDVLSAYKALFELKKTGAVKGVGIGSKDWTVIRDLYRQVQFDWAMFACAPTLLNHPADLIGFVAQMKSDGVELIDSAVFNGGFLMGSDMLDYRRADPVKDAEAFMFRSHFQELCAKYLLDPAAVAVEYAFRLGFDHVALNTSSPERIIRNAEYGLHESPEDFWRELRI